MLNSNPKSKSWIITLVFLVGVILVGGYGFNLAVFSFTAFHSDSHNSFILEVQKGHNPNEITKSLTTQGVISNGKSFILLGRIGRYWKRIKAGEYQISGNMSPVDIFSVLTSGISVAHPVTVKEGENMFEIANSIETKQLSKKQEFLTLCRDSQFIASLGLFKSSLPHSLEGYLFPDTYFFNRTLTTADITRQMVKKFFLVWGKKEEARAKELNMTLHEVVTLASIIEKETGAPEERPLISSVFHNRLKKRMKLQSDPTTIYGKWDRYDGKLHRSDLTEHNAYNTYSISGLPIGPIANPGREAIQAALHPAESPFLYFVSHNDGTHQFSRTFDEHNQAVQKFQIDPKAREGKSWRDRLRKPASRQH